MVKKSAITSLIISSISASSLWAADIRFYKINKHQQTDKIWVSKKKSQQSGCHNFRGKPRIFKVVQVGYDFCSLYQEKNCTENALIKASHEGIDAFASRLQEGYGWLPSLNADTTSANSNGVAIHSWKCQ